jgi:cyclophilin family peptidyl-prolyl cis-trans isomerase
MLLLGAALLAGCGKSTKTTTVTSTTTTTTTAAAATTTTAAASAGAGAVAKNGCTMVPRPTPESRSVPAPTAKLDKSKTYIVRFVTNCGTFTVKLDQAQSPNAAASFVSLVQHNFFDKTVFHRIVPGFIIQGGDPTQTGSGSPGYSTVDTPPASASYTFGTVAMAKTSDAPDGTGQSQFFIVTEANAGLPPQYAIFGNVGTGQDVIRRIGKLGDANQLPTQVIEIFKATVSES